MLTATWVATMAVLAVAFVLDNAVLTFGGVALGGFAAIVLVALRSGDAAAEPTDSR